MKPLTRFLVLFTILATLVRGTIVVRNVRHVHVAEPVSASVSEQEADGEGELIYARHGRPKSSTDAASKDAASTEVAATSIAHHGHANGEGPHAHVSAFGIDVVVPLSVGEASSETVIADRDRSRDAPAVEHDPRLPHVEPSLPATSASFTAPFDQTAGPARVAVPDPACGERLATSDDRCSVPVPDSADPVPRCVLG